MTAASPLLVEALRDRYVVERELGRGGMATVYLARDVKHDRPVALKVLRPELAGALGPERFLREIKLTARLDHPHILPVFDSGTGNGHLWYTMPFVDGESLRDMLRREGQLSTEEAVRLAREIADALDCAHRHGVIHRDVKPENVLLSEGHARVADFGVARAVEAAAGDQLTATGLALGTPAYMAPEQATGGLVDARADVYALGCVTYEMLAGEPPYGGPSAQAIIAKRFVDPVPSIRRLRAEVPESVDAAVQRALARTPADRYATAGDFAAALGRLGSSGAGRPRWGAGAAAALALVLTVALGGRVWQERARNTAVSIPAGSLAVLDFTESSGDTAGGWLADGLMEEVIVRLSGPGGVPVKRPSRAAVLRLRDSLPNYPVVIGREMGVRYLLEGSVRRLGPRVRVTIHLTRAVDGTEVWSRNYERSLSELAGVQGDIAGDVAAGVSRNLSPTTRAALRRRTTSDPVAYEEFLRAHVLLAHRSAESVGRALELYEAAAARDPRFTRALARAAYCYAWFAEKQRQFRDLPPDSMLARGLRAARTALDTDSTDSDTWMALGYLRTSLEPRSFSGAREAFERAITFDPSNAEALHQYAWAMARLGRDSLAAGLAHRALDIEPERPITLAALAVLDQVGGHIRESRRWLDSALLFDPDHRSSLIELTFTAVLLGDTATARSAAYRAGGNALIALAEASAGHDREARHRLGLLLNGPLPDSLRIASAAVAAAALVQLGDLERAVSLLMRARGRGPTLWVYLRMPLFDALRGDRQFQRLEQESRPSRTDPSGVTWRAWPRSARGYPVSLKRYVEGPSCCWRHASCATWIRVISVPRRSYANTYRGNFHRPG